MIKKNDQKLYWFQGLVNGMDQATDTSLTGGFNLLSNISQDQVGNLNTRLGSDRVGSSLGANSGQGIFTYDTTADVHTLMAVYERDLYTYTEGTATWATIDTDEWVAGSKVDAVNFANRLYIGGSAGTDPLCYTTGSAVVDVTPTIGGNIMAVNKDILFVGGNSILPNVGFYSDPFTDRFYSATGTCAANADVGGSNYLDATTGIFEADIIGAIVYNTSEGVMRTIVDWVSSTRILTDGATSTWDNDTIYIMTNVFKQDGKFKAVTAFKENFVSFDEWNMYIFDPTSNWSSKVPGFGCVNNRTLKNVGGRLIWLSRDGIYMYDGNSLPVDITPKITDKINGYGVMDIINEANYSEFCAGVKDAEGKYYISLGTLTTKSGSYVSADTNVVMVFDTNTGNWTHRQYQGTPLAFTSFINSSGSKDLYAIHKTNGYIAKYDTGSVDDGAVTDSNAITVEVITPFHLLSDNPSVTTTIREYYVKYKSANAITLTDSVDNGSFATLATLPASSNVKTLAIVPTPNREGFTHALKFTTTGLCTILAYGFVVEENSTTYIPKV